MAKQSEIQQILEKFKSEEISAAQAVAQISNISNKAASETASKSLNLGEQKKSVEEMGEAVKKFTGSLEDLGNTYGDVALSVLLLSDSVGELTKDFRDTGIFSEYQVGIDSVAGSYKNLGTVLKSFGASDEIVNYIQHLGESSSYARQMESSLVNLAVANGTLNQFLEKSGDNFENLDDVARNFDETNFSIAQSMHVLQSEVDKVALSLGEIPGAMNGAFDVEGVGRIQNTQAAMTLAKATGQDYTQVARKLKESYDNFNMSLEQSITLESYIASTSKDLQMPLKSVQSAVDGMSESFRKFGDNTKSSVDMMRQLVPSLKEVGVANKQIGEIAGSVATSISQMTTAQRAFLSARTGGPGGLRGAMQIESMMMNKDAAGIARMSEEALRKQFGRVVGVEEAGRSQAAAAQFERQKQLLSSGAFGMKLEGPDATKFLDAMSKGKVFDVTKITKKPEEALNETMLQGNEILLKNTDATVDLTNSFGRLASAKSFQDLAIIRKTTGIESAEGDKLRIRSVESRKSAAETAGLGITTSEQYMKSVASSTSSAVSDTADVAKSTVASIMDAFKTTVKDLVDRGKIDQKTANKMIKSRKEELDISASSYVATDLANKELTAGNFDKIKGMTKPASTLKQSLQAEKEESERILGTDKRKKEKGKEKEGIISEGKISIELQCPSCHNKHLRKEIERYGKEKGRQGTTGQSPDVDR